MSTQRSSLAARHADLTQALILESAVELLETASVTELSVRAVAKKADISERTVFRYFASRDDLLDAVALEISRRLDAPPNPETVEALIAYPEAMFARFEATAALTRAALHSELYHRIRARDALGRGAAIRALVDRLAPGRSERERRLAAASIHYQVIASTWRYYRDYFGFPLEDAAECARMAIVQALRGLDVAA
ncbi:MAG TPA: helix-turn-helix domain-containing protein [Phenylobacterium sp.]|nr:helix-turn-helix domain-containing protein [Phenylobacterium sp.]